MSTIATRYPDIHDNYKLHDNYELHKNAILLQLGNDPSLEKDPYVTQVLKEVNEDTLLGSPTDCSYPMYPGLSYQSSNLSSSCEFSPSIHSGNSNSPRFNSTPSTPGNNNLAYDPHRARFVYEQQNSNPFDDMIITNGGLSPQIPRPVRTTPPCIRPEYSPASPKFDKISRPSTTSLPPFINGTGPLNPKFPNYSTSPNCGTTPRQHPNIITVFLPCDMHTKVKYRQNFRDAIQKALSMRNIRYEECNFFQKIVHSKYGADSSEKMIISWDKLDIDFVGNQLFVEYKNPHKTSNSPHNFKKKKLFLFDFCYVCNKRLFKDFFVCENCKYGFHEKCLQNDFICPLGSSSNNNNDDDQLLENGIRNKRLNSHGSTPRSRSSSEHREPSDSSTPPPEYSECVKTQDLSNPVYFVPTGHKIGTAKKLYQQQKISSSSIGSVFSSNSNGNSYTDFRKVKRKNKFPPESLSNFGRSIITPKFENNEKKHSGYKFSPSTHFIKKSYHQNSPKDNLRSRSISNLDSVLYGNDQHLSGKKIGSAPTSPKSSTPTPTTPTMLPPRVSYTPCSDPERDVVLRKDYSNHYDDIYGTIYRAKVSNLRESNTWEVHRDTIKLFDCIGQGSYGTVYKGEFHGDVAVKELTCNNPSEEQLEAFKKEIAILRKTRHDNILLFRGYITKPLGIVTSWCNGNTLYYHLHVSEDELPQDKINQIVLQTSQGMSYLHDTRKIIHRDLKSQNIFLLLDYTVKIGDFGLATVKSRWSGSKPLIQPQGSVLWMAPEVMRAGSKDQEDPYTFYSDVYSFGIVLFELITGELPFKDIAVDVLLFTVGMGLRRPQLTNIRRGTPDCLTQLCQQCISFEKEKRPLFSDFSDSLEEELTANESDSDTDIWITRNLKRRVSESNLSDLLPDCREIQTLPQTGII